MSLTVEHIAGYIFDTRHAPLLETSGVPVTDIETRRIESIYTRENLDMLRLTLTALAGIATKCGDCGLTDPYELRWSTRRMVCCRTRSACERRRRANTTRKGTR